MPTWIVLLRGINVGGKNIVPMKMLTSTLEGLGCSEVKTYIQSGNIVLRHSYSEPERLAAEISQKIEQQFTCAVQVLTLRANEFKKAVLSNPYPDAESAPKTLHLFFLVGHTTDTKLADLAKFKKASESFQLVGNVLYLHAPEGIGRSKLVQNVDKCLGVSTTARNWNTAQKLMMLSS